MAAFEIFELTYLNSAPEAFIKAKPIPCHPRPPSQGGGDISGVLHVEFEPATFI